MKATEERLEQLRAEAARSGSVAGKGVRAAGAPLPEASAENGYYGLPLLKPPVWTWEVPLYFFVGGAAGASAVLAVAAQAAGADERLVRDARRLAAAGAALSTPLLIADLGRPERFLNMLRVFKPQSPMSVGAWTLVAFGTFSSAAVAADELQLDALRNAAGVAAAAAGLGMATYTGVLLGVSSIPAWYRNAGVLPIQFGASALASAASLLELRGHDDRALQLLAAGAAAAEVWTVARERGTGGENRLTTTLARLLSGPIPLLLRASGFKSRKARRAAAISAILGSFLTRSGWIQTGKASASESGKPPISS